MQENLKIWKKSHKKKPFFFFKKSKNIFFVEKKIACLLVLQFKVISLQPELSSPPHFRIQGGRGGSMSIMQARMHGNPCV